MPKLECTISQSLWDALNQYQQQTGESLAHIVQQALAKALEIEQHTLFQVSTSGALVEGLYQGAISIGMLKEHGDFGLGTFEDLDGEMIGLDGHFYQASAARQVQEVNDSTLVPFAVVTHFQPKQTLILEKVSSFRNLVAQIEPYRTSNNLFYAIRCQGHFELIKTRAPYKTTSGIGLVKATSHQAEFEFKNIEGTLIGFWTPTYASAVNIPGYHFHFLSQSRLEGGHLLDCQALQLQLQIQYESDFRLAIPETAAFLKADLTRDPRQEIAQAESDRSLRSEFESEEF